MRVSKVCIAAVWDAAFNSNPQDLADRTYSWIQAIAQAEHDLAPYLDLWLRAHRLTRIDTSR